MTSVQFNPLVPIVHFINRKRRAQLAEHDLEMTKKHEKFHRQTEQLATIVDDSMDRTQELFDTYYPGATRGSAMPRDDGRSRE